MYRGVDVGAVFSERTAQRSRVWVVTYQSQFFTESISGEYRRLYANIKGVCRVLLFLAGFSASQSIGIILTYGYFPDERRPNIKYCPLPPK